MNKFDIWIRDTNMKPLAARAEEEPARQSDALYP